MKTVKGKYRHSSTSVLLLRTTLFVLLAVPSVLLLTRPGSPPVVPTSLLVASNSPTALKRLTIPWYFRNNQWSADMRTLAGMLHYLADSPALAQTNASTGKSNDA